MLSFKFLSEGAVGPFSSYVWPTPSDDAPGAWVESSGGATCAYGIHACEPDTLSTWLARELWIVELDGPVSRTNGKLVAPRGRLVRRIDGWDPGLHRELAIAAALRARDMVRDRLARAGETEALAALDAAGDALGEIHAAAARGGVRDDDCALALGYAGDAAFFVGLDANASLHCAAHAPLSPEGYARERAWQSSWIAARLDLEGVRARAGRSPSFASS